MTEKSPQIKSKEKEFLRRIIKVLIGIFGSILALSILIYYSLPWNPVFDDGPFYGKPCSNEYQLDAAQEFKLGDNFEIEVGITRDSLVIIRSLGNKSQKWCKEIYGFREHDTRSIVISEKIWLPFLGYRTRGIVNWIYGEERAFFDFNSKGELKRYYFSW